MNETTSSFTTVSGETPSLQSVQEFREILQSFGMNAAFFDDAPATAQVYLVGQYLQIKRQAAEIGVLHSYAAELGEENKRLRAQRDELRCELDERGELPDEAQNHRTQPLVALKEWTRAVRQHGMAEDSTTTCFRKPDGK